VGKNAFPPFGRKRIFAKIGATPFPKHCPTLAIIFLKKGCGVL